jgi:hypothetical protein
VVAMVSKVIILLLIITGSYNLVGQVSSKEKEPELIEAFPPIYPVIARVAHVSQTVVIEAEIDKDGKVQTTKIKQGHPLLNMSSEKAAKKWVYSSSKNTEPRKTTIIFSFLLVSENPDKEDSKAVFIPPNKIEVKGAIPVIQY